MKAPHPLRFRLRRGANPRLVLLLPKSRTCPPGSDWKTIAALDAEAASLRLVPSDLIEWTPFLQAYAYLGQTKKVKELAVHFKGDSFHNSQLCESLNKMSTNGYHLQPDIQIIVNDLFCK